MQFNNTYGCFNNLLDNRKKKSKLSIKMYFSILKYFSAIILFNSINNFTACQAQTLSNLEQLTVDDQPAVLSESKKKTPINIIVSGSHISNLNKNRGTTKFQNHTFAVRDRPITVQKIDVSGNSLFQTEIDKLTKIFTNKSTTLRELYKL